MDEEGRSMREGDCMDEEVYSSEAVALKTMIEQGW